LVALAAQQQISHAFSQPPATHARLTTTQVVCLQLDARLTTQVVCLQLDARLTTTQVVCLQLDDPNRHFCVFLTDDYFCMFFQHNTGSLLAAQQSSSNAFVQHRLLLHV
jgi:hypothetical protein